MKPMALNSEILRYILGIKLRRARQEKGYGLKELAGRTGVSVSYLSEIEKGKKYPKHDKLLHLAGALDVTYEELVSPRFEGELGPLREIFESPFVQEFPFHLYGIELESLFSLLTEAPSRARALVRTALEIGRLYDLEVEHFLLAALRSYQDLHGNFFPEIENLAADLRRERGWAAGEVPGPEAVEAALADAGVAVENERLARNDDLADLRSVWVESTKPQQLLINDGLLPSQRAFVMARELGYRWLGVTERSATSPALSVESFDQVINDFEAAYFAGAVLLDRDALVADLRDIFGRERWSGEDFLGLLGKYRATPEMFFYRLSQLLPGAFDLRSLFFVRFHHPLGTGHYRLTKILNMSPLAIPFGTDPQEHYCRRWPGLRLLGDDPAELGTVSLAVQRSVFPGADDELGELWANGDQFGGEYLMLALTRPLALKVDTHSSVNLALRLGPEAEQKLQFLDDPVIARKEVHLTCERCPLAPEECAERAAPATLVAAAAHRRRRQDALGTLLGDVSGG